MRPHTKMMPDATVIGARRRDHATAAVFGSSLSIALAFIYWLGRTGFSNPIRPIAVTVGLALFVICVPTMISSLGRHPEEVGEKSSIWLTPSLLALGCFGLT